jgi:hypothetical protein
MGFGGPVWHASAAHPDRKVRRKAALRALDGVGEKLLGEWHQDSPRAYHVRRRLTPQEQQRVGDVLDLRGTEEARARCASFLDAMVGHPSLPVMRQMAIEELLQQ